MIDVLVELLTVNRHRNNKTMEGTFTISSASLKLRREFRFLIESDNLTSPKEIATTVWKEGKEFLKISGDDAFYPGQSKKVSEPQRIVLASMDEALQYFFGVHKNAPGIPKAALTGFQTEVPDEMAMEILAVAI